MTDALAGRGLLDTSAVIDLAELDLADLPQECLISAITLAELSVGALVATNARQRAARQAHLQQAEADFDPVALMRHVRVLSVGSLPHFAGPDVSPRLAPMTP